MARKERTILGRVRNRQISFTPEQDNFLETVKNKSEFIRALVEQSPEFKAWQEEEEQG